MQKILKAVEYATRMHAGQTRDDGTTPYVVHPIGVANLVAGETSNTDTICIALLHDILEDTKGTYEEISEMFGKDVADGVLSLTDDKNMTKKERKTEQLKRVLKLSAQAEIVKMADKLYNLRDMTSWPLEKKRIYAAHAYLLLKSSVCGFFGAEILNETRKYLRDEEACNVYFSS